MKYTYLIYYAGEGERGGNGPATLDAPIATIADIRKLETYIAGELGVGAGKLTITGFDLLRTEGQPEPTIDLYALRDAVRKVLLDSGERWIGDQYSPSTDDDGWYVVYRDICEAAGWSPAPMEPAS